MKTLLLYLLLCSFCCLGVISCAQKTTLLELAQSEPRMVGVKYCGKELDGDIQLKYGVYKIFLPFQSEVVWRKAVVPRDEFVRVFPNFSLLRDTPQEGVDCVLVFPENGEVDLFRNTTSLHIKGRENP